MKDRDCWLGYSITQAAGIVVALLLPCYSSAGWAVSQGVAGEALLVPLALYDTIYGVNTKVYITVPAAVGSTALPNEYTAQHTSPTVAPLGGNSKLLLRWSFYDSSGNRLAENVLQAIPDSIVEINWGSLVKHVAPALASKVGYLIIQSDSGAKGDTADFNMFGHAIMTLSGRSASIPVFAMSDGQDAGGNLTPTFENEVIGQAGHSPLATGIATGAPGGDGFSRTRFDLTLGSQVWKLLYNTWLNSFFFVQEFEPTLLVIWHDHSEASTAFVYDQDANYCSMSLPLGDRLNLYWVSPPSVPSVPSYSPGYIPSKTFCEPMPAGLSKDFFLSVFLQSSKRYAAAVAFSLVFSNDQVKTWLARERGQFTQP